MAAEVTLYHGEEVISIDYTPASGNITAGQVVLLGNTAGISCGVAPVDIVNAVLGSLQVGNGVYAGVNLNNAANYATVYWDDTNNKFTTTSTNNAKFGYVVEGGGGGANSTCYALHAPGV